MLQYDKRSKTMIIEIRKLEFITKNPIEIHISKI